MWSSGFALTTRQQLSSMGVDYTLIEVLLYVHRNHSCCFLGTGAQDVHLNFHIAPYLCCLHASTASYIPTDFCAEHVSTVDYHIHRFLH